MVKRKLIFRVTAGLVGMALCLMVWKPWAARYQGKTAWQWYRLAIKESYLPNSSRDWSQEEMVALFQGDLRSDWQKVARALMAKGPTKIGEAYARFYTSSRNSTKRFLFPKFSDAEENAVAILIFIYCGIPSEEDVQLLSKTFHALSPLDQEVVFDASFWIDSPLSDETFRFLESCRGSPILETRLAADKLLEQLTSRRNSTSASPPPASEPTK